ncbi:methyltransferase family protein [Chitinophaga qingshengii]|uniref:Isoprenylcysteine carboxylmethyltransferase family protein n=1 Tax=Chitinophaga qingshengii TaxID=1569794 RepID=A0ABR7TEW1_9BACT|nr:isoprenylcysteine carboxylmethyltransferase family protein [Chitinophaga qingshengii]MBC9928832.1 isoprenylcysteine carboxylmethyltransferase family protein [Chitinophaga qingshengii]
MNILSSVIYMVWFLSEILLHRILRGGAPEDKKRQDKGSLAYIWIVILISINVSIYLSYQTKFPILQQGSLMNYIGLSVILLGMILRFYAIASLGRLFTVVVTIRKDHRLKKDGIYSVLRHPAYAGSLLSFLGFGLSLNNWLGLVMAFIPVLAAFIYRMDIEEKMLTTQFGNEYNEYMQHTHRILPWIY